MLAGFVASLDPGSEQLIAAPQFTCKRVVAPVPAPLERKACERDTHRVGLLDVVHR